MNPWYAFTYEAIIGLADWYTFDADIAKKIVGIYSWMPRTIMNLNMSENRFMCDVHSLQDVTGAATRTAQNIAVFNEISLQDIDIEAHSGEIEEVLTPLFTVLGSVAASKYFHFSRPRLFPMWDSTLRKEARLQNSPRGFVEYMQRFQAELCQQENMNAAEQRYGANVIRGWDIVKMENRNIDAKEPLI